MKVIIHTQGINYISANINTKMSFSTNTVILFLLLTAILVGLITSGNFLTYAQEYAGQNFIGNDASLYSTPQNSLSTIQPLQSFPVATPPPPPPQTYSQQSLPPPPQTYSQQSLPPPPIQNVQLTQQQVTVEICSNGIDDDRDGLIDEVGCTTSTTITVEICSNGIDDDRDGLIDEVGCTFQQQQQQFQQQIFPPPTPIIPILPRPQPPQQSPISQCEVYTLTVKGTSNLAKVKESLDKNTDLTFEINSVLVPYDKYRIDQDLVSGKVYIDKDTKYEKELNYHIKRITNDCRVIAYLDDNNNNNHNDNNHNDNNDY
jgi:hypothetical protein